MLYSTTTGQQVIPYEEPDCHRCPYFKKRCGGPNGASVIDRPDSVGCFDPEKQIKLYENLRWAAPLEPAEPLPTPELPNFIPQITDGVPSESDLSAEKWWAISFSTLFDENGCLQFRDPEVLRKRLRLHRNSNLLLSGVALDDRLEAFWKRCEQDNYWQAIRDLRFSAATSLTFSVWGNDPRFDQVYNQDRNEVTFDILNSHGIPTIPFFFCAAPEDYDRAATWLGDRPAVTVVGVFARYQQRTKEFDRLLRDCHQLARMVRRPYRHLLVGPASREKINCAREQLGRPIIVNCQPVTKAINAGEAVNEELIFSKAPEEIPRGDLLRDNVARFREYCAG